MKTLRLILLLIINVLFFNSCKVDNYDFPSETLKGEFVDKLTKEPFQTSMGATGIRIRMMEYSWSDNPVPYDFYAKMDGTFYNNKIFAGEYGIIPTGAFVPLEEQRVKVNGECSLHYEVEPFLRLEWIGEPIVNSDGTAEVQVKISRGTVNSEYQQPLAEVWLYVSETTYVGDFSYSPRFSTHLTGYQVNDILDKVITIKTGQANGPGEGNPQEYFPTYSRKFFLRVGARIDTQVEGSNVYNYTTIKEIQTMDR